MFNSFIFTIIADHSCVACLLVAERTTLLTELETSYSDLFDSDIYYPQNLTIEMNASHPLKMLKRRC